MPANDSEPTLHRLEKALETTPEPPPFAEIIEPAAKYFESVERRQSEWSKDFPDPPELAHPHYRYRVRKDCCADVAMSQILPDLRPPLLGAWQAQRNILKHIDHETSPGRWQIEFSKDSLLLEEAYPGSSTGFALQSDASRVGVSPTELREIYWEDLQPLLEPEFTPLLKQLGAELESAYAIGDLTGLTRRHYDRFIAHRTMHRPEEALTDLTESITWHEQIRQTMIDQRTGVAGNAFLIEKYAQLAAGQLALDQPHQAVASIEQALAIPHFGIFSRQTRPRAYATGERIYEALLPRAAGRRERRRYARRLRDMVSGKCYAQWAGSDQYTYGCSF